MSSDSADSFGATMSKTASEPEDRSRTVRFPSLQIDTHDHAVSSASPTRTRGSAAPRDTIGAPLTRASTDQTLSPLRRRAGTFKPVEDYGDFEMSRPGWQPGSEPGFDPNKSDGGHASMPTLRADCDISVFDFSQANMVQHKFGNEGFIDFLQKPQEPWVKSRWINVNGLSWDVIQACGQYYKLHKLAIEDIMNTRNRTKADWYANHAFIVLTLQKLVLLLDEDSSSSSSSDDDSDDGASVRTSKSAKGMRKLKRAFTMGGKSRPDPETGRQAAGRPGIVAQGSGYGHQLNHHTSNLSQLPETAFVRTLQRYHASANEVRTEYMETHSSLISRGLAVSAEQVAIFLTSDNTVISFFEMSAEDIERPITVRLGDPSTILRQSCDASLVVQAIIDAIIDLAIPLTAVYSDVIGDLELDVLTSPSIKQTRSLYICVSEINKMLTFLNPIDNLVNVLRDHRTELGQDEAARQLQNPASGVIVTPLTHTYLGDVLDHCVIITESMQQIKRSADNLIDLIFNTISANQNESMKQLTIITIIFLPLTFLTGYFGQNFTDFPEIENKWGITFFWIIACPVVFCTILIMMRSWIWDWCVSFWQKRKISADRKKQKKRRARRARRRAKAD
ncbi:magnesium and cobalt transporter [Colletotrichum tofieldiae]|uniref:Magnesium and cobalt transporter n=1 Tax=Colletotrichum tofieldiae TaxID=708197 RepID=A0A161WB39_9PEZI|nr:magnesium and cobalt transporter [Colletotrichum tofieldiae]GKT54135.1 magnesium and cobalt transporter [Colletotrichum tofieldiae]GKT73866.1 magnesium and cobalt transporter [Colletotrichum tofieldiae]GKT95836.1 magnesium and cobalt transporter [Colletotrichum tofieldiae]